MAVHFHEMTGVDPLTIDQTDMTERGDSLHDDVRYRYIVDHRPNLDGDFWETTFDSSGLRCRNAAVACVKPWCHAVTTFVAAHLDKPYVTTRPPPDPWKRWMFVTSSRQRFVARTRSSVSWVAAVCLACSLRATHRSADLSSPRFSHRISSAV